MADPNKDTDNFVEVDGVKYKEDPENEGEALMGDDGNFVPFEEKKVEEPPKETEEEKIAREKKEEEEDTPPTRKSVKDRIIERRGKKIKKLEEKLKKINQSSAEEIKELYKFILHHQKISPKGGGGLGLVDIARKTGNNLNYKFYDYNKDYAFFKLSININALERN